MQQKYKSFLREVLVVLALIMLVSFAVNLYKTWDVAAGPTPLLQQTTINNMPVNLAESKKPVLVHFWATWCPVCSVEQGSIQSIAQDYNVISIALSSGNKEELLQFMQNEELDFPVIADEQGDIARQWQVKGVPTSFIISPGGAIAFVESGYTSELGLRARLWWSQRD